MSMVGLADIPANGSAASCSISPISQGSRTRGSSFRSSRNCSSPSRVIGNNLDLGIQGMAFDRMGTLLPLAQGRLFPLALILVSSNLITTSAFAAEEDPKLQSLYRSSLKKIFEQMSGPAFYDSHRTKVSYRIVYKFE